MRWWLLCCYACSILCFVSSALAPLSASFAHCFCLPVLLLLLLLCFFYFLCCAFSASMLTRLSLYAPRPVADSRSLRDQLPITPSGIKYKNAVL